MNIRQTLLSIAGITALWEGGWWIRRRMLRTSTYAEARKLATKLNKPLIVVGAPDQHLTAGYDCGDVTVDLMKTSCPVAIQADITKPLPFADDSVVVFVSCVLEYVNDINAAYAELERISGGNLFVVRVEPWTLTAYLYPGTKQQIWSVPVPHK